MKLVAKRSLDGDWYLIVKPGNSMFGFGKMKKNVFKHLVLLKNMVLINHASLEEQIPHLAI